MEAEIPWITADLHLCWLDLFCIPSYKSLIRTGVTLLVKIEFPSWFFWFFCLLKGKFHSSINLLLTKNRKINLPKNSGRIQKELSVVGGGVRFFSKGAGSCHAICNAEYSASFEIFARLKTILEQLHLFRSSRLG